MNSEADSSITPSTSVLGMRKSRNQVSAIWAHCHAAHDNEDSDSKLRYCIYYIIILTYSSQLSTNIQQHLK